MVKELYNKICTGMDIRSNLILLKKELKDENNRRALAFLLAGNFEVFIRLLAHEDAKIRKNAVLILGEMECDDLLPVMFQAYQKETQLFVKSDYLKAISKCEYQSYLPVLKLRMKELQEMQPEEGSLKHIREENRMLQSMILKFEKPAKHRYTGYDLETEVILLTNRNHRQVTKDQITSERITMLAGGVKVLTDDLKSMIPIRTYSEMLFPIPGLGILGGTPDQLAEQISQSELVSFLSERHSRGLPFYFRVEMKSPAVLEKKSAFLKKFSAALEEETGRKLVNSTSDYEIELRLIENKEGKYIPLLKLFTIADNRFRYRKQAVSSSISPVNAALFMQLAKPYLKENAQILDPFCGVGTMLVERFWMTGIRSAYGLDIFEEAVTKARVNTDHLGMTIHYINRNFFDFTHEYLFDEILTNMPEITRTRDRVHITELYQEFFEKVPEVLKPDGIILLYSKAPDIIRNCLGRYRNYEIAEEWVINDREETCLFLIRNKEDI